MAPITVATALLAAALRSHQNSRREVTVRLTATSIGMVWLGKVALPGRPLASLTLADMLISRGWLPRCLGITVQIHWPKLATSASRGLPFNTFFLTNCVSGDRASMSNAPSGERSLID